MSGLFLNILKFYQRQLELKLLQLLLIVLPLTGTTNWNLQLQRAAPYWHHTILTHTTHTIRPHMQIGNLNWKVQQLQVKSLLWKISHVVRENKPCSYLLCTLDGTPLERRSLNNANSSPLVPVMTVTHTFFMCARAKTCYLTVLLFLVIIRKSF